MPGSIAGYVNQSPLYQFVVLGNLARKPLKIIDREQGAGRHGMSLHLV